MKTLLILLSILLLGGVLTACSKRGIESLKDGTPPLRLEEFFKGETIAWGIFEDRFGNLRRQFRVNITGTVEGNTIILDEDFLYDDGEKANRIWTITNLGKDDKGLTRYEGSAADINGSASGRVAGNALNWVYDIDLQMGDRQLRVKFNDFIYQQDEHVAINRAYVSKFGVEIGSVTLVFMRGDAARALGPLDLERW
ncbi:MAG: DUF3833 domain-containing protein [Candidatus Puniceispirillales bacterium]